MGKEKKEPKITIKDEGAAPPSTMAKVAKYELPACGFLFVLSILIIIFLAK